MGIRLRLRSLLGFAKDRVAVVRARARGRYPSLQVALICATSHKGKSANEKRVQSVLSAGTGSRMRMAYCIRLLMNRLSKTRNWVVALKCLILIHRGVRNGGFMFQDQVSSYPVRGGRNYLNLSRFKDNSSAFAWEASFWIRWYAKFLEKRLLICRTLGNILDSKCNYGNDEKISALENDCLLRDVWMLNDLVQEICVCPTDGTVAGNELVRDAISLVVMDSLRTQDELRIRLIEVWPRLGNLTCPEIRQFVQVCERLTSACASLVNLIDVGLGLNLLQTYQCPEKIFFTDFELTKLRQALTVQLDSASANASDVSVFQCKTPWIVGGKTPLLYRNRTPSTESEKDTRWKTG